MSKPPLIHFPGALFHITARGNNKREIFFGEKDFRRYLKNLSLCREKYPFKLHSFVLMPNHLHLLIEVGDYSIDKIMQVIQTGYTMYFNKKYEQVGHLFQGRYHSFLVDKDSYLLALLRYIHLNPVRAGVVESPEDYLWSSHLAFLNPNHEFNKILDRITILANFSQNPQKQIKDYADFVLAGSGGWEDNFPKAAWGQIIGSEKFVNKVEARVRKMMRSGRF